MPGPYEGVHGFLFLHEGDTTIASDVIETLSKYVDREGGPVFFASTFEGDFVGFAHFAADDLPGLVDITGGALFDAGVRSDYATEGAVYTNGLAQPMGPKRKSPRWCAICRVHTNTRSRLVLEAIGREFDDARPLVGASRVIGSFPILVELGTREREDLDAAIERLGSVAGVESLQVGITDTRQDTAEGEDPPGS